MEEPGDSLDRLAREVIAAAIHKAQMISYLKATGCRLALLINFNVSVLKSGLQRIVLS